MKRSTAGWAVGAAAGAVGAYAVPGLAAAIPGADRFVPQLAGRGDPLHVALTFDDGPDPASTPRFLEVFDALGVRATFFVLGAEARRVPALVKEMVAAGHEIGVHGERHASAVWRTPRALRDDVARCFDTVVDLTGEVPRWYRPPFGALSFGAIGAARAVNLQPVLWTAWGRDWRADASPESVVAAVTSRPLPGATVLLHDVDGQSAPGSWRAALGAIAPLVEVARAAGLTVGPLRDHGLADSRVAVGS